MDEGLAQRKRRGDDANPSFPPPTKDQEPDEKKGRRHRQPPQQGRTMRPKTGLLQQARAAGHERDQGREAADVADCHLHAHALRLHAMASGLWSGNIIRLVAPQRCQTRARSDRCLRKKLLEVKTFSN